jgi:hypothetical protein
MLFVLSPAKKLDFTPGAPKLAMSTPRFAKDTAELSDATRKLRPRQIGQLMSISPKLAELNFARYQAFDAKPDAGTLQAVLAFDGDVYDGLAARELDAKALTWAQDHLRILSGLYGVLRPLDVIQPYRLEMGTRLKTKRGHNLYDFWGKRIADSLNADADGQKDPTLVNLASQEYFGAIDTKTLKLPKIDVRFLDEKDGKARTLFLFAKQARGMMARWAVEHRAEKAKDLQAFDRGGYRFDKAASTDTDWVFTRPQPPPVALTRKLAAQKA